MGVARHLARSLFILTILSMALLPLILITLAVSYFWPSLFSPVCLGIPSTHPLAGILALLFAAISAYWIFLFVRRDVLARRINIGYAVILIIGGFYSFLTWHPPWDFCPGSVELDGRYSALIMIFCGSICLGGIFASRWLSVTDNRPDIS